MSSAVRNFLQAELHKAGFDAFDAHATYDALRRDEADAPDYWIEIASSSGGGPVGGVGVGGSHVVVDISVVVARVAAEVRVYDGRSLELVQRFELDRTKTGVMPTSIGVGGRDLFGWIALPIMHYAQYRAAAREVARDAALRVAQWRRD